MPYVFISHLKVFVEPRLEWRDKKSVNSGVGPRTLNSYKCFIKCLEPNGLLPEIYKYL